MTLLPQSATLSAILSFCPSRLLSIALAARAPPSPNFKLACLLPVSSMGHNWISFGLPPVEMLLRPPAAAFDLVHSSNDDHESYFQYFFPPAPAAADLKLEDLLTAAPCSDPLAQVTDAQDFSSAGTAVVEVSSPAATGPLVPAAAGQRTSVYRGVTR